MVAVPAMWGRLQEPQRRRVEELGLNGDQQKPLDGRVQQNKDSKSQGSAAPRTNCERRRSEGRLSSSPVASLGGVVTYLRRAGGRMGS